MDTDKHADILTGEIHDSHENGVGLSPEFIAHAEKPLFFGEIDRPDGRAKNIGSCGDAVEIFIQLGCNVACETCGDSSDYIVKSIGFLPKGCAYTIACGSALCKLVAGNSMDRALTISPGDVAKELGGLPEDHYHCARLAVNTLGEAVSEAYRNKMNNNAKG